MRGPWSIFRKPRAPLILRNGLLSLGVGPIHPIVLNQSSASSGTNFAMRTGSTTGTGEEGKKIIIPFACSLVHMWMRVNVTSYTSGDYHMFVKHGGEGVYNTLVNGSLAGVKATGNNQYVSNSYAAGTYPVAAGDGVLAYRTITGAMGTDEHVMGLTFLLDEPPT